MSSKRIYYKLSKAQSQILYGTFFSLEPKEVFRSNLIDFGLYVEDGFDADAMEKALQCLLRRNDALRLHICWRGGLRQYIAEPEPCPVTYRTVADREEFEQIVNGGSSMSIFTKQLVQATIMRCEKGTGGGLYLVFHHICSDGYSQGLMHERLDRYYACYKAGQEPPEEKEYSVLEYFRQEDKYMKSAAYQSDKKYWRYAYNHQPHYSFPTGRNPLYCHLGTRNVIIDGQKYLKLMELCDTLGTTLPALIMTLSALTTYCLTGEDNFALYSVNHGRNTAALRKTIACIFNTSPVFYDIPKDMTAREYIRKNYPEYLNSLAHGRFPSSDQILLAAKETFIKRFGYNHLWFILSPMDYADVDEKMQTELIAPSIRYIMGQFYVGLLNNRQSQSLRLEVNYQNRSFTADQIEKIVATFSSVLDKILEEEDVLVKDLRTEATEAQIS